MLPSRFVHLVAAGAQFGAPRVARLGAFLSRGDGLGDAASRALEALGGVERHRALGAALAGGPAAEPVRALVEQAGALPLWVDPQACRRGGEVILKAGLLSGLVLGMKSLVGGYCSPAGNKPLVFTRRLEDDLPKRLLDTARFVRAVCETGVARGSDGFAATLHVRLIHSRVRVGLTGTPRWREAEWGTPINQYDMSGTVLLFSLVLVEGLEQLGMRVSAQEKADVLHLWRAAGHVLGVEHELLSTSWAEAKTLWAMLEATQELPDADAGRLARALLEGPLRQARGARQQALARRWVRFSYQASRALLGDRYADALGYPKASRVPPLVLLRALVSQGELLRRWVPLLDGAVLKLGQTYWERSTAQPIAPREGRPARQPDAAR